MKRLQSLPDEEFEHLLRQAVALPEAPPALLHRALRLWQSGSQGAATQSLLRRIAAVLSFDSWAMPAAAAGVRSGAGPTRHLLYSAQGRDIDLRITQQGAGFSLAGQVLGPDEAGQVELAPAAGGAARSVLLDALGEFRIEGIVAGDYVLTLRLGEDEILLPAVWVGAPSM